MAEEYVQRKRRIFYKSESFKGGLNVKVRIYKADTLDIFEEINLSEVSNPTGVYYFDYDFNLGTYLLCFYENLEKKIIKVYEIIKSKDLIKNSDDIGPNVI